MVGETAIKGKKGVEVVVNVAAAVETSIALLRSVQEAPKSMTPQTPLVTPDTLECSGCGKAVPAVWTFCAWCGAQDRR